MTEKRFRVQEHCLRSSYGIEAENWLVTNDNHCVVLNDKAEAHMVANMCNDVIDVSNTLHEENEKLKAQLHCTHDGVCDICNNEYLVQQGKYYVSKCKKGHEECSKMDLSYCEDFELKSDDGND